GPRGEGSRGQPELVAGRTTRGVRRRDRRYVLRLRHRAGGRDASPADVWTSPELVARPPLHLLRVHSERRLAALEDARRRGGHGRGPDHPVGRRAGRRIAGWPIRVLRQTAGPRRLPAALEWGPGRGEGPRSRRHRTLASHISRDILAGPRIRTSNRPLPRPR